MAKIIFLGTAASIPSEKRDNTSFVFINKKEHFLIDCPGSIIYKLKKANINYKIINKIIITHHHPDHLYGLPHFIHARIYTKDPIYIFSNQYTIRMIKKTIILFKLNKNTYPAIRYIDVFDRDYFFSNNGLVLKAIANKHTIKSFGIIFVWGRKSLLYSSDTALSKNIIKIANISTYLIHDCTASSSFFRRYPEIYKMHTNSLDLARTFKNSKLKIIMPVHFLLLNKYQENKIKNELKELGTKLLIPEDYRNYTL